jgi:predicted MFS family arabinose efflux permease
MALVGESLPPRERGRYQGYLVACFMSASAAGPTAGGWLTQHFGWQGVFLAGLPLVALGGLMAWRLPRGMAATGGFRFDTPGTLCFTVFVIALVAMLDQVQRLGSEGAMLLATLFGGVAVLALMALLRVERRVRDPLLPLSLLGEATIWRTNLLSACVAGALVALISFLPLYLTVVRGVPIATVGLMLLPMSLGGGVGALISGLFLARTGRNMLLPSLGLVLTTTVLCGLAFWAGRIPLSVLPWLLALSSFGFGTTFPAVQTTVQPAAGPARLGVATASVQFVRNLGSATGTALLGALLFGAIAMMEGGLAERLAAVIRGGREALAVLTTLERAAIAGGLAEGFRIFFGGAAAIAGLAAVMAWRVPLRRL